MVEAGISQVARDDDVGPVAAADHVQRVAVVLRNKNTLRWSSVTRCGKILPFGLLFPVWQNNLLSLLTVCQFQRRVKLNAEISLYD